MKAEVFAGLDEDAEASRAAASNGERLEVEGPVSGSRLRRARVRFTFAEAGEHGVNLSWLALVALFAYGRSRGVSVRELLPLQFERTERYMKVMSASQPGRVLLAADNSCDVCLDDGVTLLAAQLEPEPEPDTYYRQYMQRGMLSLVFGPETIPEPRTIVPTFDALPNTGHATSLRTDARGRSLRRLVAGCRARPIHTHYDHSAFVVELDGEPVLIDRGIVRYDDPRANAMKASTMHNVLTPVLASGDRPDQAHPREAAVIPEASGDERRFEARVDLGEVWAEHAEACERRIVSEDCESWTVRDAGRWKRPLGVAFHVHALSPFEAVEGQATLEHAGQRLRIRAPWAKEMRCEPFGIDFAYRTVHRLTILGEPSADFDLVTTFERTA